MAKSANPVFISAFSLFFILLLLSSSMSAREVEDQRGFDYIEGSPRGPQNWGDLKAEWVACKIGTMQSPIDISIFAVKIDLQNLEAKINYKPSNAIVENRGRDVAVNWLGDAGSIQINGIKYPLIQSHFHSPSEHTVNGRRYDLEIHLVHENLNIANTTAVVGLFYTFGAPDPFITKLTPFISSIEIGQNESFTGLLDPRDQFNTKGIKYYKYLGSLTTPPCDEGVTWIVGEKAMTVSREQVKFLRDAVRDNSTMNARPLQDNRNRRINKIFIF